MMKKNPIQDIKRSTPSLYQKDEKVDRIKVEKKIKINTHPSKKQIESMEQEPMVDFRSYDTHHNDKSLHRKSNKRLIFVILCALVFLVLGYFLSIKFGHVKVYITPKQEPYTLTEKTFEARRAPEGDVAFEIMILNNEVQKDFELSESKVVNNKAKGLAVIYNTYSKTPQKLTINTRLEANNKKIYMTDKAVTIPGYTLSKAGKVVPGSVEVGVTASATGDSFNTEPTDFVIVGFKGTAKASKIYARSKGAIAGGASGEAYIPTPEEKGKISAEMDLEVRSKLEKEVNAQVPAGYVLLPGSLSIQNSFNPDSISSPTKTASIKASSLAKAIILHKREFEEKVIKTVYENVSSDELAEISSPKLFTDFEFKLAGSSDSISKETQVISFTVSGSDNLLWTPNLENIKNALLGVTKDQVQSVFGKFSAIGKARLVLIPPWQSKMPLNINYIKVKSE